MPGPKINDDYWFTYSENLVNRAQESRDQAAEKLQNLALWLWGIYTSAAAVGFTLAEKELAFWPTLLIAVTSAVLIAVYWGTVWVRVPLLVEFDPRSPTEIRDAYADAVQERERRLNITLCLSVLAAALVAVSVVVASLSKKAEEPKPPALAVSAQSAAGKSQVAVTALVGKTKEVRVAVLDGSGKSLTGRGPDAYLPSEDGRVYASIPIASEAAEVVATVEWDDEAGMTIRLSRKASVARK